jgi:triosephosphate isomerase (TIM)
MRTQYIIGNWKMHGDKSSVQTLLTELSQASLSQATRVKIVVCPAFVFLEQTQRALLDSAIAWGAQNVCSEPNGAYTGEVSASMLQAFGCQYVLIGHSERRILYHEKAEQLAKKIEQAVACGIRPVFCVGETWQQYQAGETQAVLIQQIQDVMEKLDPRLFQAALLAYEPVWAIGTGLSARPEQVQAVHQFLRQQVAFYDATLAQELAILYGGSVKAANAQALFSGPDVDGALVGGASLVASEFLQIYEQCLSTSV